MADPVISAVTKMAAERVGDPIATQLGYVWNYKTNIENLHRQHQKLKDTREAVQYRVDEAKGNGHEIEPQVVIWLDRAEEIDAEVTKIIEDNNRANMRCFKNLCPDLKKRYQHSKEAARTTDVISELLQEGEFDRVSYRTLRAETWYYDNYENIESRRSTLEAILNALRDHGVDMVGVYGIGGSGKTTLVKEVARIAERDMLFDKVVFVEVSASVDIARIQQEIAVRLGLKFDEGTASVRADRLRDRIMQESKILLILDNIWKDLDLAAVGIPSGNNDKGCRLLLTSRDNELLNEMGSKTNFSVEILEEEEACNLFMKMAGVGEEQHNLRSLAIEVAKECGGLLVAIITIAKALRNKPECEWRVALRELRNPLSLENVGRAVVEKAYASIRLSYTNLGSEELKSTFLLCSIMGCPENASIEELLRYAVGLSLFNAKNTVEEIRYKVKKLVQKLKDASLLLGTPNGETFSIHGIVHNVGRWIASSQQHKFVVINNCVPRSWAAKTKLENFTSITLHDIDELPKSLECRQLKFFYMKTKVRFTKVPDEFFEGMPKLEVLHLVEIDLSILPESFRLLRDLRTLNLDMCHVGEISKIKAMENLVILVLSLDNEIKQLPEEIGQLTSLRLLDLRKSSFIIPPKVISRLTQLEELYMDDWYDQRQVEELNIETSVASLEELKDLSHLTALHICVADAKILPKCMVFRRLKRYNILIGDKRAIKEASFFEDKRAIRETLRTLQVRSNTNLCSEDGVITQLNGIEDLLLDGGQRITNVLCELDGEGFPKLRHFRINNNPFILYIVDSMLSAHCVAFPLLETLSLSNLVSLEKICHDQIRIKCFSQLRTIKVQNCHKLKNLFSFSIAKHLSVLQEIVVVGCWNMEEIFIVDRAYNEGIDPVFLKQLHSLTLRELPRLKRICSETEVASTSQERRKPLTMNASLSEIGLEDQIDALPLLAEKVLFPASKYLELHDVDLESIWPNQLLLLSCWVQILTRICIKKCGNLKYVFSSSTLGNFNHLQHLEIRDCKDLEELIQIDDKCSNHVEFPSLEKLEISNCPELREFIFSDKVSCPSLQEINIFHMENLRRIWQSPVIQSDQYCPKLCKMNLSYCSSLENIFPASIARKLWSLEVLDVVSCGIKEIVIEEGGVEAAAVRFSFPQLTSLYLCFLKELSCFYPNKHTTEWPKLKELKVVDCEKIGLLNFQKHDVEGQIDDDQTMQQPLFSDDQAFLHLEKVTTNQNHLRMTCQSSFSKYLFPKLKSLEVHADESTILLPSILEKFHNLEELELNSSLDEEIFSCEKVEKRVGMFAQLKTLRLFKLSNLKQIWKQESKMDLIIQKLEFLEVLMCHNLINLIPPSAPFKNLKILQVSDCNRLISLVPASAANSLMVLEEMSVYYCKEMTEIIENQGDVMEGKITFSRLKSLKLYGLANLTSFYSGNYTIIFPLLKQLAVGNCLELKFFSAGALSTPNLQKVWHDFTTYNCEHPDLNATYKQIHDKKVFSILEQSILSGKELRLVWDSFPKYTKVFSNAKQLKLSGNDIGMMWQNQFPEHVFPKLKYLDVFEDRSTAFPFGIFRRFHDLKKLKLKLCSYEEIFSYEEKEKYAWSPPQTKCLRLASLGDVKQMWEKDSKLNLHQNLESLEVEFCWNLSNVLLPSSSFKNLKIIKVNNCEKLRSLMVVSTTKSLVQLEEMQISQCKMMAQVVANGGDIVEDKIIFHKLKKLELDNLSSLTRFSLGNYTFEIPVLEKLTMKKCPKMEIFTLGNLSTPMLLEVWQDRTNYTCKDNLNEIVRQHYEEMDFSILEQSILSGKDLRLVWNSFPECTKVFTNAKQLKLSGNDIGMMLQSQFPEHIFPKLKCLDVSDDRSTTFPLGIFQRFHDLKKLKLRSCSYEEIFSYEEIEKYAWSSPRTKCLRLASLGDVKQMWEKDSKLNLHQNLDSLEVEFCWNLSNILLPSSSFESLKIMKVNNCEKLRSLMVASTTKSLVQLEEMQISQCKMMAQVVAYGGDIVEDKIIFHKLKKLELNNLSCLTSFSLGNYTFEIPVLEKLTVKECPKMEIFTLGNLSTPMLREVWQDRTNYTCKDNLNEIVQQHYEEMIFSRKELDFKNIIMMLPKISEHQKVFPNLKRLSLRRDEIDVLCQSQFPQQLFPKLKLLKVFEDESIVFPLAILQKFRSVEKLDLNCSSYEEIFSCEDFEKYEGASAQIKWLRLCELDNLKQMWKQDSSLDLILPNIDKLQVECCGSLVTLMPPSSSFRNLRWLTVEGCDGLMNLLAPTTAKILVQLEEMSIRKCKTMTEVMSSNEEAITNDEIIFNKLEWLQLEGLSSLTSFCPGNYTFTFPCLSGISLENCPKIKFFSSGVLNAPNLGKVWHDDIEYYCNDDLNATIQGIHEKPNVKTPPEDCAGPSTLSSSTI